MPFFYFLWICLLGFSLSLSAQERDALKERRNQLNRQIQETNRLLQKTSRSRQSTLNDLHRLRKRASAREDSIKYIQEELTALSQELGERQEYLEALQRDAQILRAHYRHLLLRRYQYRRSARYLAAQQAGFGRRYSYLRHFEIKRRRQILQFAESLRALESLNSELKTYYENRSDLAQSSSKEKADLDKVIQEKNRQALSLKKQEGALRQQLAQSQKQKSQLNSKIESVIRNEIASERAEARKYPNAPKFGGGQDNRTGSSFKQAKGKLPMPLSGKITGHYGKHPHPDYPLVVVENNGIDIQSSKSQSVKAVYEGVVVSVFAIPGLQNAVMLKHGDYYTTYSNLGTVSVKRGQKVSPGTGLGSVGKESGKKTYLLHFEVWRGKQKENPALWLR